MMDNPVTPQNARKHATTLKDTYKKDFLWIGKSHRGLKDFLCIGKSHRGPKYSVHRSDFSLAAGRVNNIRNHVQTAKHQTNLKHAKFDKKLLLLIF